MTSEAPDSEPTGDIPETTLLLRAIPKALHPYARLARLDRPIGTWLLLFPCWWSLALAAPAPHPDWPLEQFALYAVLFAIGALVMRGAGCTYNDIIDRDFDAQVARTRARPIPSGAVTVKGAVVFLCLQLLLGLGVLITFNGFTIGLGIASLALIFAYPFMKRITHWPQAFLGLTFNWGALLGYAAITNELAMPAYLLYAAGFFWTLGYDTIYAHQDRNDDLIAGIKSLALRLDANTKRWLVGFYGMSLALLATAGHAANLHWAFYVIGALALTQLLWQVLDIHTESPGDCLRKFKSNRLFGWLVLAALIAGQVF